MKSRLTVATINASIDFARKHCAADDHDKLRAYFMTWLESELSQSGRPGEAALATRIADMLRLDQQESAQ